jgi:Mlc titration factor MtfA (ptsG expression regulator)
VWFTGIVYGDEVGGLHRLHGPLAGEAMPRGPVVLSWPDVEASADWSTAGMNLVIHEFAHKLDMRSGEANGCPPLPAEMPPRSWQKAMNAAFEHFRGRIEKGEETAIDPYAAESPAEFFAVLSEVFFADPTLLLHEYPKIYELFSWFYKQDPASRTELLLEE